MSDDRPHFFKALAAARAAYAAGNPRDAAELRRAAAGVGVGLLTDGLEAAGNWSAKARELELSREASAIGHPPTSQLG